MAAINVGPSEDDRCFTFNAINHTTLERELTTARDFNGQVNLLRSTLLLDSSELDSRQELAELLEHYTRKAGIYGKFHLFGSSANSLGFKDADVDFYFETDVVRDQHGGDSSSIPRDHVFKLLNTLRETLSKKLFMRIWKPLRAKVPIIVLDFEVELGLKRGLKCDISVTSDHGVWHSKLLSFLSELEPSFQELALATKYWMKKSNMLNHSRLTSFAATLMVVFYMQQRSLLPAIRSLQKEPSTESKPKYEFECDLSWKSPLAVKPSTARLFLDFFEFYRTFAYTKYVISPHFGCPQPKNSTLQELNTSFTTPPTKICVQDVFDLSRNQSQGMSDTFQNELIGAFSYLSRVSSDLQQEHHNNEQLAAKLLFEQLIHSHVIVSNKKKNNIRLSMGSVSEWRRARVLKNWHRWFPLITRTILENLLDVMIESESCDMFDGISKTVISSFKCHQRSNHIWQHRDTTRTELKLNQAVDKRFIQKEKLITEHLRQKALDTKEPDAERKFTLELAFDPNPKASLIEINLSELSLSPENHEFVQFMRTYVWTFFKKYFNSTDDYLREDMSLYNVQIIEHDD